MLNVRRPGTTTSGHPFDPETILAVWNKAIVIPGQDPHLLRKDRCGGWIFFTEYGATNDLGWEIDHEVPVSHGGSDALSNLQPLQWQNNRVKGDNFPNWICAVSAHL